MIAPRIPADEEARLESLRALGLVDTEPEERFDALSRLAVQIFDVPVSYISLMESDRQFIKSNVGLTYCSTDRDTSFCGHTIYEQKTLVIPDTHEDERFRDNPMVTGEPFTRFYCGQPLFSNEGYPIATLCLLDTKPRSFSPQDLEQLTALGALAERELSLGKLLTAQHELLKTQDALLESQKEVTRQLDDARRYVLSRLPEPLDGPIRAELCFVPCSALGGDALGYHWLNEDQFAVYLLDVCGHGVGAALLSVSAMNTLLTGGLRGVDWSEPEHVLRGMNRAYAMEEHSGLFFTLWYGVIDVKKGVLSYSSAGHPPAILSRADGEIQSLAGGGLPIGCMEECGGSTSEIPFGPGDGLYVFTDGIFEIPKPDGTMGSYAEFRNSLSGKQRPKDLMQTARDLMPSGTFPDDVAVLRIQR